MLYPQSAVIAKRFWSHVDVRGPGDCWEWKTYRLPRMGYGTFSIKRKMLTAHRYSWELAGNTLLKTDCVLHICDNPPCVNPAHLRLGSKADNNRDMYEKGRCRSAPGEAHGMARLKAVQVLEIRARVAAGERRVLLASEFGVCLSVIGHIVTGRSWRSVT